MKSFLSKFTLGLITVLLSASIAFAAMTLGSAKKQGLIGERPDGLLGIVVPSPAADVAALVDSVNAERIEKYKAIAAKNGTAVDQVRALAGKKLIQSAEPGEFVMNAGGEWQQK